MRRLAISTLLLLVGVSSAAIAGCGGGGQYGYARTYAPSGTEQSYMSREVDLAYQDVRRFPDRQGEDGLLGWFGTVTAIEWVDEAAGRARLTLELRVHQERHLCGDETTDSCRVTVSERVIGPFVALVDVSESDRSDGEGRLWTGSLVKIYGRLTEAGDDETGPTLEAEHYRHWPHGTFVTTASRGSMRR